MIVTGYNGPARYESHCAHCTKISGHKDMDEYCSCLAIHAEQNAIISASRREMIGSTMYLAGYYADTGEENHDVMPCEICLRLIKDPGIDHAVTDKGTIYWRTEAGILVKVRQ